MIPALIGAAATILSKKNAQSQQTANSIASGLGQQNRSWDELDDDEIQQMQMMPNADFGTFGG